MKTDYSHNSNSAYKAGWDTALRNYDVCEIESIKQLVNSAKDLILPQLASTSNQGTDYFPLTSANSHYDNF